MKLGFSSIACPRWDLPTIVAKAKEFGYSGVELRGLLGQMHLPLCPDLTRDPTSVKQYLAAEGVELVCLSSSAAFHYRDAHQVADNKAEAREYIELAGKLGCPYVRVFGAEVPKTRFFGYESRDKVLVRIAEALRDLAPIALQHRVTLLIENSGDFVDSQAIWYLVEAANTPAVRACWAPFAAMTRNEIPSISIKRLASKIALLHLCDGKFDGLGGVESIEPPGKGSLNVPLLIELLRGIAFDGHVVIDWPKLWNPDLADADRVLPDAQKFLKPLLDSKPVELTAYKNDRNAPKFRATREPAPTPV